MRAVDQWREIEESLDGRWTELRLAFAPEGAVADAAAILLPLRPGRVEGELRLSLDRALGDGTTLRNLLARLDERRVWGTLTLLDAVVPAVAEETEEEDVRVGLVDSWDALVASLPPDWSDILCELELDSSDWLPRAALLGAPLNPSRVARAIALRFRASSGSGYGTPPSLVRRCLERMDAEGITGRVGVVLALSDTDNAVTQGPVWRIAGKSV